MRLRLTQSRQKSIVRKVQEDLYVRSDLEYKNVKEAARNHRTYNVRLLWEKSVTDECEYLQGIE